MIQFEDEVVSVEPPVVLSEVKLACIANIISNNNPDTSYKDDINMIKTVAGLQETRWDKLKMYYGVDACNIPRKLLPLSSNIVVWFQCPWDDHPGQLIENFLLNTADKLRASSYVCVGITSHTGYVRRYHLDEILGAKLKARDGSTKVLTRYTFLGADTKLIARILEFGYHHQGKNDIHDKIKGDHLTLVFQKL